MGPILRPEEAEEDRQADQSPSGAGQSDYERHYEAVAPTGAVPGPLRLGAVVEVVDATALRPERPKSMSSTARRIGCSRANSIETTRSQSRKLSSSGSGACRRL